MSQDNDAIMSGADSKILSSSEEEDEMNITLVHNPNGIEKAPGGAKQYGLYLFPDAKQPATAYLLAYFASLGEVESCAKLAAAACLNSMNQGKSEINASCLIIHGKEITILKNESIALRYKIVPGRTVSGMFINEADWAAGKRKPDLVAYEPDVEGRLPRKVTLEEGNTPKANKPLATSKAAKRKTSHGAVKETLARSKKPAKRLKIARYSASAQPVLAAGKINPPRVYCICRRPDDGEKLIACESGDDVCPYNGWFHLACQGLEEVPEGEWWCPLCRQGRDAGPDKPVAVDG